MRSIATDTLMRVSSIVFLTALSYFITPYGQAQLEEPLPSAAMAFATPEQAAEALIRAAESYDVSTLLAIFGPDGKDFISSSDPVRDKSIAADFAAKAREKHLVSIDPKNKAQAILTVGKDDWPLPVPIVKRARSGISIPNKDMMRFSFAVLEPMSWMPSKFVVASSLRRKSMPLRFTTILESINMPRRSSALRVSTTAYTGRTRMVPRAVPSARPSLAPLRKVTHRGTPLGTTAITSRS